MFRAQCDRLDLPVLIWAADVLGICNTAHGIILRYRCHCGELAESLTGAGSSVSVSVHLGDAI
jgi:hypothetical protein